MQPDVPGAPPPLTSLVGRTDDVAAVLALLGDPTVRMLTVVGAAGVGKTAVVAAVTQDLVASGTHVTRVDLSDVDSTEEALAHIESGFSESAVARTNRIVVVDGLERIRSQVRTLDTIAAAHPDATLLATSRAATGLFREYRYVLGPLPCPATTGEVGADPVSSPAIRLFLDHARRVAFEGTLESRVQAVGAVCRRLEGLPLALVIAAHQLSTMTVDALLARLEDGWSPVMRGPSDLPDRHRTLSRTISDSLASWTAGDLSLVLVLATFDAVIGPAAASAILTRAVNPSSEDAVVDQLSELVQYSLLRPVAGRSARAPLAFVMPITTRDYARRLLRSDPRRTDILSAHAHYFLTRVHDGTDLVGTDADAWLTRTDHDLGDIRSALRFFLESADERALDMAAGMRAYWLARGLLQEGLQALTDCIPIAAGRRSARVVRVLEAKAVLTGAASSYASVVNDLVECADRWRELENPVARARTLVDLAAARVEVDGFEAARPLFEEAINTLDQVDDTWWVARARSLFGASAATTGEHRDVARANLDRAVEGFRSVGDSVYTNVPLQQLGRILHEDGHTVQATALLAEGLRLAREAGDAWNISVFLNLLAEIDLGRGNAATAATHYLDSLALAAEIGAQPRFIWCLEGLAVCLHDLGESTYATRLVGLALSIRSTLNLHGWVEFPARPIDLTGIPTGSPSNVTVLHAEGFRMTVGDVLAYAPQLVEERSRSAGSGRRDRFPDGLTKREVQVLRLIASGSTSRAIATELVISIETVGRHIGNLYRKIGVSGRAEATAYAIRSGLTED